MGLGSGICILNCPLQMSLCTLHLDTPLLPCEALCPVWQQLALRGKHPIGEAEEDSVGEGWG